MVEALVLIVVDPKIEGKVIDEIKGMEGVTSAHYLYGPYDIYVKIDIDSDYKLHNLVINKIRKLYGIKTTLTLPITE